MKRFRLGAGASYNSSPDTQYYNVSITNMSTEVNPALYPTVQFSESRTTPFLDDVSQYEFSIVRFTMDGAGKALPLFIPYVQLGQSDINRTVYSVGLEVKKWVTVAGVPIPFVGYCQKYVEFRSQSAVYYDANPSQKPDQPIHKQDLKYDYYYVTTYDHWLVLVNETIKEVRGSAGGPPLNAAYVPVGTSNDALFQQWQTFWNKPVAQGGAGQVGPAPAFKTPAPSITYTGSGPGGLFQLHAPSWGFGGADRKNPWTTQAPGATKDDDEEWTMYFDTNMYNLFYSFPVEYVGLRPQDTKVYKLVVTPCNSVLASTSTVTVAAGQQSLQPSGVVEYVMTQEAESTSTIWSPVENITFCSTLLPVQMEATNSATPYGQSTTSVSSTSAVQPIVTDIAIGRTDGYSYNQFIAYTPTGEYRMASLVGTGELRQLDIAVFWKCRQTGELVPLTLPNGSSVALKIMFRKKI